MRKQAIGSLILVCMLLLRSFASGQSSTYSEWISAYINGFLEDEHSPLDNEGIRLLHFFPFDSTYVVEAAFTLSEDSTVFVMPTSSGKQKEYIRYGIATFQLNGQEMQLTVFQSLRLREMPEYADYLFIPYNDDTNGSETYGGGRYMDLRFADLDNSRLIIDFNRSYNPYCAYSDGYSCPVPPNENRLPVSIRAGEMNYGADGGEH